MSENRVYKKWSCPAVPVVIALQLDIVHKGMDAVSYVASIL